MNTQSLIQNLRERVLPPPKIQFPCPVCERDIEIKKTDSGADLLCPHCTAWIAAPVPHLHFPAQIRDQTVLKVRQFQQAHGQRLVDLKRGRFEASVLRKQKRIEAQGAGQPEMQPPPGIEALNSPAPPAPAPAPALDHSIPNPGAGTTLSNSALEGAIDPASAPDRSVRLLRPSNAATSFQPLENVPVVLGDGHNVLSWEEGPGADLPPLGSVLSKRGKILSLAGIAAILITAIVLVKNELSEQRHQLLQGQILKQEQLEQRLAKQLENARKAEAVDFARRALAAPSWTSLLPHVRHPDRIRPLMEEYYADHTWQPLTIAEFVGGKFEELEGRRFFAFEATDAAGESFIVGLEETPEGWKIDWEVLVPLAQLEWDRFLADRPFEPRTIRVNAIRRTPSMEMLTLTRIPEEEAFGVMFWCNDIAEGSLYTVLDKKSVLAQQLAALLSVSQGKKLIVDAAFLPSGDGLRNDLVTISRVVTMGWTVMEEHPPAEAPRRKTDAIRNAFGLPSDQEYAWNAGDLRWEPPAWKDPQRQP